MKYRGCYSKYFKGHKKNYLKYKRTSNRAYGIRGIIRYYGGKHKLSPKLIKIIKLLAVRYGCNVYAELCGGGARTLLNIPNDVFMFKIYNEYSLGLCRLFSCVKDEEQCVRLIELLHKIEYNKKIFEYAKNNKDSNEIDTLTGAALTYISTMQSRNADMENFKLGKDKFINRITIYQYYKQIDRIRNCTKLLEDTTIINGDMRNMLEQLSNEGNVLCYIDPPYHPATRAVGSKDIYPYELTREEHQEMVEILLTVNMVVILSGYDPAQYDCNDYEPLNESNGWQKVSMGYVHRPSSGKGGYSSKKEEFIWIKHPRNTGVISQKVSQ